MAATKRLNMELIQKYLSSSMDPSLPPLEKIRSQCLSRGASGIRGLARLFRIMDDDGNKNLSLKEFKKGLHDYGIDVSNEESFQVFKKFDRNESGSIDFEEFLEILRPPMNMPRRKLVLSAFRKMDKNGDGVVSVEDLKGVYNPRKHPKFQSGEWNEDRVFKEFLESFEIRGNLDGIVTEEEFMSYYSGVSASVDNDAYFDLMMRNAWKL